MKKVTVSIRKDWAKRCSRPYGKGISVIKVIDIDMIVNEMVKERRELKMDMNVQINIIRHRQHKDSGFRFKVVRDPETLVHYGMPIKQYPDGNVQWTMIEVQERNSYNLNNISEARMFVITALHPSVDSSPFSIDPQWTMKDQEIESKQLIKKAENISTIVNIISEMNHEEAKSFGRLLGLVYSSETMSSSVVKSRLLEEAISDPGRVLKEYKSKSRQTRELFLNALEFGIIVQDETGNHFFGGRSIGHNVEIVAEFLDANIQVMKSIDEKVKDEIDHLSLEEEIKY